MSWRRITKRPIAAIGALVTLLAITVVTVVGTSRPVYAGVNDFTVTSFTANYYLTDRDPQGEMRIVERINVDFTDQNHGLERALPETYNGHPLQVHISQVSSESGAPAQYATYESNGNTVVRIGSASQTVTGSQEYTVDYTVDNVLGFFGGRPELYWNINGVGWSQPFDKVTAQLHLPGNIGVDRSVNQPVCYSGTQGSKDQACTIQDQGSIVTVSTTRPLAAYGNLSLTVNIAGGAFHGFTWRDWVAEHWKLIVSIVGLPLLVGGFGLTQWLRRGRDAKGRGTIVPQYDAPDKMTPLEVGTIVDFSADRRDLTATIIDLAIRKYVRIVETKQDKLIGKDTLHYELTLLNADFTQLNDDERLILSGLFTRPELGAVKKIDSASSGLAAVAKTIDKRLAQRLADTGYFRGNPLDSGRALSAIGAALIAVTFFMVHVLHAAALIGSALAAGLAFFFAKIMPARTEKGVLALEHIKGLKLYLETAEADRIKLLQSPDAAYAAGHDAPTKTVDLFEKLLPYAIVLGVEKAWAAQFESLYLEPPDWYAGNWTAFNVGYLVGSLGDGFQGAVNTSFAAPQSSGSSGFGGGGFSGGGGGGGGGGGW